MKNYFTIIFSIGALVIAGVVMMQTSMADEALPPFPPPEPPSVEAVPPPPTSEYNPLKRVSPPLPTVEELEAFKRESELERARKSVAPTEAPVYLPPHQKG